MTLSLMDEKRLQLIVKAIVSSGEKLSPEAVIGQFHYETGRMPERAEVEKVVKSWRVR